MTNALVVSENTLVELQEVERRLIAISTIAEAKAVADAAEALRVLAARAKKGLVVQNRCAYIKLLAERRAGELLEHMVRLKGRPGKATPRERLSDLGIDSNHSHRWRALAKLTVHDLEAMRAECDATERELTAVYVRRNLKSLLSADDYIEATRHWGQHWKDREHDRAVYDGIKVLYQRLADFQPGAEVDKILGVVVHDRTYLTGHDVQRLRHLLQRALSVLDRGMDGLERRLAGRPAMPSAEQPDSLLALLDTTPQRRSA